MKQKYPIYMPENSMKDKIFHIFYANEENLILQDQYEKLFLFKGGLILPLQ